MFLLIGDDISVRTRDVVLILDADTATKNPATRRLWQQMERDGLIVDCAFDLPRSLILVKQPARDAVLYLSRFSPATLRERANKRKGRNSLDGKEFTVR